MPGRNRPPLLWRAAVVTALVVAVFGAIGGDGQSVSVKKRRFQELSEKAGDAIAVGDLAGAETLLEEALALKPSSAKTANDLGVVLLQWVAEADVGHSSVGLVREIDVHSPCCAQPRDCRQRASLLLQCTKHCTWCLCWWWWCGGDGTGAGGAGAGTGAGAGAGAVACALLVLLLMLVLLLVLAAVLLRLCH